MKKAYKLLRIRKDGSFGPLFINRKQRIPIGKLLFAEEHKTVGYKFRPGWHCTVKPYAPHLSLKGRVWFEVRIEAVEECMRPANQGGLWYLAQRMMLIRQLSEEDVKEINKS